MTGIETLPCSSESSSHKEEAALLSLWGLAAVSCRSQANKSGKKREGNLYKQAEFILLKTKHSANEKNKFKR